MPRLEDVEYLRARQAKGAACLSESRKREDGTGKAAVGDQLERSRGSGVAGGPNRAERVQERANAGERSVVRAGQDSRVPLLTAGTEPSTGAWT